MKLRKLPNFSPGRQQYTDLVRRNRARGFLQLRFSLALQRESAASKLADFREDA